MQRSPDSGRDGAGESASPSNAGCTMSVGGPLKEAIVPDDPRMSAEDTFVFRCGRELDCFTRCCADVSIVLTPYDVLRLKRALGLDSSSFLRDYTFAPFTKEQKIPIVLLRMDAKTKKCPLLGAEGCRAYANRPWACRMYPLGLADPKNPNPENHRFYFLLKEEICHGHGQGCAMSVREWIADQGIEEYEMMGAGFRELMLHDFWAKGDLSPQQVDMFYMACYDLDRFRRFVFETKFLTLFDIDEARAEAMRSSDEELLEFAMLWLRFALFQEKTLKIKPEARQARRQAAPARVQA